MNMKNMLLTLLIAGLGCSLSLNAMQRCRHGGGGRGSCPQGQQQGQGHHGRHRGGEHHGGHHGGHRRWKRPFWKDVQDQPNIIQVKENNQWVQYEKTAIECPPRTHAHWEGHHHHHGQHQHQNRHRLQPHIYAERRVKYQRDDKGETVDGVMNVKEQDGKCWQYKRMASSNTSEVSAQDQQLITTLEAELGAD